MPPKAGAGAANTRRQHIQSVIRVFRRRGAKFEDIRDFLEGLFGPTGRYQFRPINCRHGQNQRHDAVLMNLIRCCASGINDGAKAPKLVVADLRNLARSFCRSRNLKLLPWQNRFDTALADWSDDGEEREENRRDIAVEVAEAEVM